MWRRSRTKEKDDKMKQEGKEKELEVGVYYPGALTPSLRASGLSVDIRDEQ